MGLAALLNGELIVGSIKQSNRGFGSSVHVASAQDWLLACTEDLRILQP
jgi:hypothetical protein